LGVDTERIEKVRKEMELRGFDALWCRLPENVLYLSGYWPLIAKRIQSIDEGRRSEDMDAFDIFNCLSYRISTLPKERGPLVYLNIRPYML